MDFSFTDEQLMLRDSVARLLEKTYDFDARKALLRSGQPFSRDVWGQFAELGLLALPFAEEVGGLGGAAVDLVPVAEVFGERLVVEPLVSSIVLAGGALAAAGPHAGARAALADIASGAALGALAYDEGRGLASPAGIAVRAEASGNGYALNGDKRLVLGGAEADVLVVAARLAGTPGDAEGLALLLVDPRAPGVTVTPFRTIDGLSAAHIRFDGVQLTDTEVLVRDAHAVLTRLVADATLVLAAQAVGAMGALLRTTAEYASTRKQFGVPIGSFQAVAHRLADMKIAYAKAYSTLMYTTALVEAGHARPRDISVLKAQVGKMGRAVGEAAVQTHGGVGMTDELVVGHYLKRLLAFEAVFGANDVHFRQVGLAA